MGIYGAGMRFTIYGKDMYSARNRFTTYGKRDIPYVMQYLLSRILKRVVLYRLDYKKKSYVFLNNRYASYKFLVNIC